MWQWSEACEPCSQEHHSIGTLPRSGSPCHDTTQPYKNKKRITFRLSFLAVRRGLELRSNRTDHCKVPVGDFKRKFYLCDMVKRKEKIEDPLKLLLPGAIYDYFELVHSDVSDIDVHLFLDEAYNPPKAVECESKGFTEQSIIQDFPLRGKPVYLHIRRRKWLDKTTGKILTNSYDLTHLGTQITAEFADFLKGIYRE